jgi:hypothetical protein
MKKILSALSFTLFSIFLISNSYATSDEEWRQTPPPSSDASWGILAQGITQSYSTFAHPNLMSFAADKYEIGKGKILSVKVCHSFATTECPRDEYQKYGSPLGICINESTDCVEEVGAISPEGKKLEVKFIKDFPGKTGLEFQGDPAANLPTSGSSFLVDIPEAPHQSGSMYLVSSIIGGYRLPDMPTFATNSLEASIWPVRLVLGNYQIAKEATDPALYSGLGISSGGGNTKCSGVQSSLSECAMPEASPLNVKFSLKFKLSTTINGWLSGRLANVNALLTKEPNGLQHLAVSANPVRVPTIFGWVKKSETPVNLAKYYADMDPFRLNMGNGYGKCLDSSASSGPCNPKYWESVLRNPGSGKEAMNELALWLPIVGDTAVAAPTTWYFRNMQGNLGSDCIDSESQISGLVTTNATVYAPGPPSFNSSDGTLDYKVLSTHFLADGAVFSGTYDLLISSKLARCIYHFTSAPIRATVSVVSDSGIAQVATTAISENDGFIHLEANGFTFSNPTIKVKLTQDAPAVVAPAPAPAPSAAPSTPIISAAKPLVKQVTITCVKGKTAKKISGTKPACPAGYKKK